MVRGDTWIPQYSHIPAFCVLAPCALPCALGPVCATLKLFAAIPTAVHKTCLPPPWLGCCNQFKSSLCVSKIDGFNVHCNASTARLPVASTISESTKVPKTPSFSNPFCPVETSEHRGNRGTKWDQTLSIIQLPRQGGGDAGHQATTTLNGGQRGQSSWHGQTGNGQQAQGTDDS